MKSTILPVATFLLATKSSANVFNGNEQSVGLRGRERNHRSSQDEGVLEKEGRIIGGSEATPNKNKYLASLSDDQGHFCGGSLIARDVVLTAAHCKGAPFDVILGRHDLGKNDGQKIGITKQMPHKGYNSKTTDNDFMLVFLNKPATLNNDVALVKVNDDSSTPSVGASVTVLGWGDTHISDNISKLSDKLMEVDVKVITNNDCDSSSGSVGGYSDSYKGQISDNMLCAKANKQDACQGDSGGPLVTSNGVQVGVVSWGISCAHASFPGVYARVSRAYDWIEREVCKGSDYAREAGFSCSGNGGSGGNNNPSPSPPSGGGNNKPPKPSNKPPKPSNKPPKPSNKPPSNGGGSGKCSKYNKWDCKRQSSCRWKKGRCLNA